MTGSQEPSSSILYTSHSAASVLAERGPCTHHYNYLTPSSSSLGSRFPKYVHRCTGLFSLNLNFSTDLRKLEGKYYDQIFPVVENVGWSGAVFPCLMIHYITSNITLGHSHLGPGSPRALSVKLSNNQSARTH